MNAMALLGEFIPIFALGVTAFVLYKFFDGRHRERLAMIEKGLNPSDLKLAPPERPHRAPLANLKWGLLAIFVGIGVFVANIAYRKEWMDAAAYPMFILIFGGIGLLIFYTIAASLQKKEEREKDRRV